MAAEAPLTTFAAAGPMVTAGLTRGTSIHVSLPAGGWLHIDRPVPFVCMYRIPVDGADLGTEAFVTAESAFFIAPAADVHHDHVARLAERIGDTLYDRFGGFLFVEVWSRNFSDAPRGPHRGQNCAPWNIRPKQAGQLIVASRASQ
jgi:hypothetical protein